MENKNDLLLGGDHTNIQYAKKLHMICCVHKLLTYVCINYLHTVNKKVSFDCIVILLTTAFAMIILQKTVLLLATHTVHVQYFTVFYDSARKSL